MTNLDFMYDTGSHDLFRSIEEEDVSTLRDETQEYLCTDHDIRSDVPWV